MERAELQPDVQLENLHSSLDFYGPNLRRDKHPPPHSHLHHRCLAARTSSRRRCIAAATHQCKRWSSLWPVKGSLSLRRGHPSELRVRARAGFARAGCSPLAVGSCLSTPVQHRCSAPSHFAAERLPPASNRRRTFCKEKKKKNNQLRPTLTAFLFVVDRQLLLIAENRLQKTFRSAQPKSPEQGRLTNSTLNQTAASEKPIKADSQLTVPSRSKKQTNKQKAPRRKRRRAALHPSEGWQSTSKAYCPTADGLESLSSQFKPINALSTTKGSMAVPPPTCRQPAEPFVLHSSFQQHDMLNDRLFRTSSTEKHLFPHKAEDDKRSDAPSKAQQVFIDVCFSSSLPDSLIDKLLAFILFLGDDKSERI